MGTEKLKKGVAVWSGAGLLRQRLGGGDWHLILSKFIIFAFRDYFLQKLCYKFEEKLFFPPPNLYDKKSFLRYLKMN